MINLDSRRKEFAVVISDITLCDYTFSDFDSWLANSGFRYYGIVHDNDVDVHGEKIRVHAHIVLSGLKRWRVKQLLNDMAEALATPLSNIQITEVVNFTASVQYLIHKNDTSKYQYDYRKIVTNDNDNLVAILNENIKTLAVTTEGLMRMIFDEGLSRLELIHAIGCGSYQHYRATINDMYDIRNRTKIG